jgi:hypothetical protein
VRSPLRSGLPAPGWLAVAFIAGAFFCGAALRFMPGLGEARAPAGSVAMSKSPWVQAVVAYQQLYSRKTLADEVSSVSANNELGDRNNDRNNDRTADAIRARRIVEAIRRDDGLALRIPDLREAGLKFARVERLSFHGRPLVQIEYLPPNGPPIALCVIKDAKPDRPIASEHVSGMRVVTWRQSELAYALVGNDSGVDLAALGNKIAERSVDELL